MIIPDDAALSDHFALREFAVSASHPDLAVLPPTPARVRLQSLAREVLEPIRTELGVGMRILSGYRSKALNDAVGGSVTSQHTHGEAVDWTVPNLRSAWTKVLAMVADGRLRGAGQMIYYPEQGFIHCALASGRFPHPTCCIHWPGHVEGYAVMSPTLAALNALVPPNIDPQRTRIV